MTVSMTMTTWEEYETYRKKYNELTQKLAECFDSSLLKAGASQSVDFDVKKALALCREFLPYSMKDTDVEIKI